MKTRGLIAGVAVCAAFAGLALLVRSAGHLSPQVSVFLAAAGLMGGLITALVVSGLRSRGA